MSALAQVGVMPDYEHISKRVVPQTGITLGDTTLKWYDIAPAETPAPLAVRAWLDGICETAPSRGSSPSRATSGS